jgi:SH3-like domain-containing protein
MPHSLMKNNVLALLTIGLISISQTAHALEFRSVSAQKAILYDAPSTSAKKILLLGQQYPVEVIVNLKDWLKVRDALGGIYWVEAKDLNTTRTVLVKTDTKLLAGREANSLTLATINKNVLLQLVDAKALNGLVQVKHSDGLTGFVPIAALWGVN